jgi:hypothetical protein
MKNKRFKVKLNMRLSENAQVEEIFPDEEWEEKQHIRSKGHPDGDVIGVDGYRKEPKLIRVKDIEKESL